MKNAPHFANQTQFTRTGRRNMVNQKPTTTAKMRKVKKENAQVMNSGEWRFLGVPVK